MQEVVTGGHLAPIWLAGPSATTSANEGLGVVETYSRGVNFGLVDSGSFRFVFPLLGLIIGGLISSSEYSGLIPFLDSLS